MYCFESKYALCLYEMIERRIGLEYKQTEEFTVEELRGLLNVPEGKLERFADFNKYCLKVAKDEINKLCPFFVDFTPIKKGRKVERVALHWFPKTSTGKRDAQILIDQHSVVRRAKLRGEPIEMPVLVDFNRPADER
jgi:plasmid replication initiation protein